MKLKVFAAGLLSLVMVGCATNGDGILLPETPLNMSDSRKAIIKVIGQPRQISENGHELFSKYYDSRGLDLDLVKNPKERFFSHVLILGDRMPYDVRVLVVVEQKEEGQFRLAGYDDEKAQKLAEKIKKSLTQSRDHRNVIDDFNPY